MINILKSMKLNTFGKEIGAYLVSDEIYQKYKTGLDRSCEQNKHSAEQYNEFSDIDHRIWGQDVITSDIKIKEKDIKILSNEPIERYKPHESL